MTSRKIQKSCCHLWPNGLRFSLNKLIVFECLYVLCSIVLCLVGQSCPTLCDPMDCSPPGSSVHGDSPGKNTGVGCHALLQGIFPTQGLKPRSPALQVDSLPAEPQGKPNVSFSFVSDSLQLHGLQSSRLLCPWNSPGKNTGVGSHFFFQGISSTQGLNPGLLHCRQILYHLSHQGSSRILEWVAYPFSRGSS